MPSESDTLVSSVEKSILKQKNNYDEKINTKNRALHLLETQRKETGESAYESSE